MEESKTKRSYCTYVPVNVGDLQFAALGCRLGADPRKKRLLPLNLQIKVISTSINISVVKYGIGYMYTKCSGQAPVKKASTVQGGTV